MKVSKDNYNRLLPSLRTACSLLKGSHRRQFLGQLALDLGYGGQSLVSKSFQVGRVTIRKGIIEIKSGTSIEDKFCERGRHKTEEDHPGLAQSIRQIVDGASQTDPKFTSTRLYTRLSPGEVLNQLKKRGYSADELPCERTIGNVMKRLGYHRTKVAKTKPKKKLNKQI